MQLSDITQIVDGGHLSWIYGARPQTMMGWTQIKKKFMRSTGTIICMDSMTRGTMRNDFFPDYKGHRKERRLDPEVEARSQSVQRFRETMLEDTSLATVMWPGAEADDLVAIFAAATEGRVPIIGQDKDLLQIPGIKITTHKGERVLIEDFRKRVPKLARSYLRSPKDIIMHLCLFGDKSDNIPRLIGVKTTEERNSFYNIQGSPKPFATAHALFGGEFLHNLWLVVLPYPLLLSNKIRSIDLVDLLDKHGRWTTPYARDVYSLASDLAGGYTGVDGNIHNDLTSPF